MEPRFKDGAGGRKVSQEVSREREKTVSRLKYLKLFSGDARPHDLLVSYPFSEEDLSATLLDNLHSTLRQMRPPVPGLGYI